MSYNVIAGGLICLIAVILFFVTGNAALGGVFVGVGAVFIALAMQDRTKQK